MDQLVDSVQFLNMVMPLLATGDADLLARSILERWTKQQMCELLAHGEMDVRRVTAVALGLIGDRHCACCLAKALHDDDAQVVQMAEHGLWSIWFRDGRPEATEPFREGFRVMGDGAYTRAIACFEEAFAIDPEFAEAYHQCAIAHCFLEQWDEAIADAQRAIERMPMHFGAMAGMGHAYAASTRLADAAVCYRKALDVHPRLDEVRSAMQRLEGRDVTRVLDGARQRS